MGELKLLSTQDAAEILGYTRNYVSWLLKHTDKLSGQLVGNRWVITNEEVERYKNKYLIESDELDEK